MVLHATMNNARLESLLHKTFPGIKGEDGIWKTEIDDLHLFVVGDEENDRLRIMIPVAQADRTDPDLLWILLIANFDRALDARYAVHDDLVWCAFLQRLSSVTESMFKHGLRDVITLAKNTGSTFCCEDYVPGGVGEMVE